MASVTVEEYELLGDPKYRSYISAVDKALKNFESTTEWADLISALGKLNKVLINHLRYAVIPRRIIVSKRLAQCLHPNLPSGVHLKALETYDILFKCIGTNRLSQELFIYSAGLFPLLGNAAMSVRPALLNIYETHFAPLATRLRPALSGFLTGVLSGLEEGSEYHDRTNGLLEKVCEGVKPDFFYGCMWECVLANPNVRLPAILFVTSHFNKKKSMEDQLHIIGTNVDILIQGLCAAVQDNSVLVQRSALDLLLMGFPMHNSQLIKQDMEKILTSAVVVVLRRDMSLNRRLWSWLLGLEANIVYPSSVDKSRRNSVSSESGNSNMYFDTYSKELLINALRSCLKGSCSNQGIDVRPYRILISLFDKPEVSSAIVEDILIEVFRTLYKAYNMTNDASETEIKGAKNKFTSTQKNNSELLKTANLLFGTFEPFYIWEYVGSVFSKACNLDTSANSISSTSDKIVKDIGEGLPSILEMCELIEFLLEVISVETYIETQTEHLPELLHHLINALILHIEVITAFELTRSLHLCVRILSKVQPPVVPVEKEEEIISEMDITLKENSVVSEGDAAEQSSYNGSSDMISVRLENSDIAANVADDIPRSLRIHKDSNTYNIAFDGLIITTKDNGQDRDQEIEELLKKCLKKSKTEEETSIFSTKKPENAHGKLMNVDILDAAAELTDAYSHACKMIIELSSFPMFCSQNASGQVPRRSSVSDPDVSSELPQWLKVLMVSACCLRFSCIQLVSVSTLLDLINITQAVAQENKESATTDSSVQGNVAVVIVPMLEISHWNIINKNTYLYQVIAKQLWDKLGDRSVAYHRQSAHLLNQLHGLAPTEKLVEDVLCQSMALGDELSQMESFRRFAAFWHFLRDLPAKTNTKSVFRMYDRCLFIMLDCLQTDVGPQRTEVQSWFTHSLQRGDISRIVEPILLVLLHPDTARVSVQHISIQQPKKVRLCENVDDDLNSEAKIYAISSVEGHVFYHVADDSRKTPSPTYNSSQSRRVVALTSLTDEKSSEVITANADVSDFDVPSSHEYGIRSPILLFVNPIGGMSWAEDESTSSKSLPDFKNARRIDTSKLERQRDESSFDAPETTLTRSEELEESTTSSHDIVQKILEDMIETVCQREEIPESLIDDSATTVLKLPETPEELKKTPPSSEDICVHPLHTHLLLYCQVYDSKRALYCLNLLRTIIQTNPRLVLCTLSTSSLGGSLAPRLGHLQSLLARHRRSVFGKGFHSELPTENVTAFRSSMLLEVFISVGLYFIRGLYPNLAQMRLTNEEISGNREVQLAATEVLTLILTELVPIVKDSGRGFASYIRDLLNRCRVQKTLLHCLLSNVYAASSNSNNLAGASVSTPPSATFTEVIIDFNETVHGDNNESTSDYSEAFQICLLRLVLVLIILEAQVSPQKGEEGGKLESEKSRQSLPSQGSTVRYIQGLAIPCQPMFLSAVICAIKQNQSRHLHQHWLALITSALPYLGRALSQIIIVIINQLCHNLESLAERYKQPASSLTSVDASSPIDYVITVLDGLTTLCHYCLLDTPLQVSLMMQPTASTTFHHPMLHGPNAGQIINNLINVFTPVVQKVVKWVIRAADSGLNRELSPPIDPLLAVRRSVLSHLPRIVSSLSIMWQAVCLPENSNLQQHPSWIMGTPKVIKQRILEFLSPITHHHGVNFLTAVSLVWNERKKKIAFSVKRIVPPASEDQEVLVNLVNAIKVMPLDTLIQTVKSVVKQTPAANSMKSNPIEVSIFQFFFSYIQTVPYNALIESWPALLSLFKEGLQLPLVPPAHFLLVAILNEFVQKSVAFDDKKDQKDLQDIAQKLIDAVSNIGGACLEQTTWLRRSLAVKAVPQLEVEGNSFDLEDTSSTVTPELTNSSDPVNSNSQYSVQALSVLAELVAPLLDVIYVSDEKEKVVPLLNNVMYNVTPYLKNHSQHNIPSFRACSQLLANLSSYQYTRKAWRRDALDLLLDASFFQMTETCLKFWQTTVDNLMTHDKVTFRDLLYRIPVTPSGSLNLFSSREQEYEQRAQLLKRLSFVIFSGEVDQYQNFMPDIQERLSESLRLPQVPLVQSQVFLCFRVLLVRMSPQHITSLWPTIITEMVTVFLQIEQELNTDSEEFSSHLRRLSTLDSSWVVSPNNGLNAHNNPAWLQLYLSVCKLLDLTLTLPADRLPQFQMYRWAFVGDLTPTNVNNNDVELSLNLKNQTPLSTGFVPHITRLAYLLNKKVSTTDILTIQSGQPLLTMPSIRSLLQLQPFFNTLVTCHGQPAPDAQQSSINVAHQARANSDEALLEILTSFSFRPKGSFVAVEKVIQNDFLELLTGS
uniref:Uncharacterized protein n=1 Tax=Strigamia maritima TaxID=126957 RepID=T1J3V3_STRMM